MGKVGEEVHVLPKSEGRWHAIGTYNRKGHALYLPFQQKQTRRGSPSKKKKPSQVPVCLVGLSWCFSFPSRSGGACKANRDLKVSQSVDKTAGFHTRFGINSHACMRGQAWLVTDPSLGMKLASRRPNNRQGRLVAGRPSRVLSSTLLGHVCRDCFTPSITPNP